MHLLRARYVGQLARAPCGCWPLCLGAATNVSITCRACLQGEELSMDYAPDKLDNMVLLDYGVLDTTTPKVE